MVKSYRPERKWNCKVKNTIIELVGVGQEFWMGRIGRSS